jgi:hypothetical protein
MPSAVFELFCFFVAKPGSRLEREIYGVGAFTL